MKHQENKEIKKMMDLDQKCLRAYKHKFNI